MCFTKLYPAEIHCFPGNESRGWSEPMRGSPPEECNPNHLPSSPATTHIGVTQWVKSSHTNNCCFSVEQHAFPISSWAANARHFIYQTTVLTEVVQPGSLFHLLNICLFSPIAFLLPSIEGRSTSIFMLNILAIYTIFALFFSNWQIKFLTSDQHSHLCHSLFAHKSIYWEYNMVLSDQNDSWW